MGSESPTPHPASGAGPPQRPREQRHRRQRQRRGRQQRDALPLEVDGGDEDDAGERRGEQVVAAARGRADDGEQRVDERRQLAADQPGREELLSGKLRPEG